MQNLKIIFLLPLLISQVSCSSKSIKLQSLGWATTGAIIGGAYGGTRNEYQSQNAVLFGSLGALTGLLSYYYFNDPDKKVESITEENLKLKAQLEDFYSPKTIAESPGTFNSKIPAKYKKLVRPGEWKISEIDQWIDEGENRLIHQDKIMELIPPTLIPNSQGVIK